MILLSTRVKQTWEVLALAPEGLGPVTWPCPVFSGMYPWPAFYPWHTSSKAVCLQWGGSHTGHGVCSQLGGIHTGHRVCLQWGGGSHWTWNVFTMGKDLHCLCFMSSLFFIYLFFFYF